MRLRILAGLLIAATSLCLAEPVEISEENLLGPTAPKPRLIDCSAEDPLVAKALALTPWICLDSELDSVVPLDNKRLESLEITGRSPVGDDSYFNSARSRQLQHNFGWSKVDMDKSSIRVLTCAELQQRGGVWDDYLASAGRPPGEIVERGAVVAISRIDNLDQECMSYFFLLEDSRREALLYSIGMTVQGEGQKYPGPAPGANVTTTTVLIPPTPTPVPHAI